MQRHYGVAESPYYQGIYFNGFSSVLDADCNTFFFQNCNITSDQYPCQAEINRFSNPGSFIQGQDHLKVAAILISKPGEWNAVSVSAFVRLLAGVKNEIEKLWDMRGLNEDRISPSLR
jgi:hypothetical protein